MYMYIKYEGDKFIIHSELYDCPFNPSYISLSESKVKDTHFKISSNNQKSNSNLYDRTGESMETLCLLLACCILVPHVYAAGSGKKGVGVNPYGYHCDDINAFTNIHWW